MTGERELTIVTAVLRQGDRVLLCHRAPGRRWYPNVWDLPGGHIEPGESPAAALVRELHEELAVTISEPVLPPRAVISVDGFAMGVWLIESWAGAVRNAAPHEHDDLAWVDRRELAALAVADLAHPDYPALLTAVLTPSSNDQGR